MSFIVGVQSTHMVYDVTCFGYKYDEHVRLKKFCAHHMHMVETQVWLRQRPPVCRVKRLRNFAGVSFVGES